MSASQAKVLGGLLLGAAAILVFVAIERYVDNRNNVEAINANPLSQMLTGPLGGGRLEPATPTITKYCVFFAVLSAIGGIGFLVYGSRKPTPGNIGNPPPRP